MPEGPEIKILADFVNHEIGKHEIVKIEKNPISKNKCDLSALYNKTWKASAIARGREMILLLKNKEETLSLKFSFAKIASIETFDPNSPTFDKEGFDRRAMLRLYSSDKIYAFCDLSRLMYWRWAEGWDPSRSPDIVTEHNQWRNNLYNHRKSKWFKGKAVFEVMLHPRFFNGVGTFCRTEILARTRFSPFTPFTEILQSDVMREEFFLICREVMEDIHRYGGLQYTHFTNPFGVSKKAFGKWIRAYRKIYSVCIFDSDRKIFFFNRKRWKNAHLEWENSKFS